MHYQYNFACEQCGKICHTHNWQTRFCSRACSGLYHRSKPADFWERVDKSDDQNACWLWKLGTDTRGYGQMGWEGKMKLAHRLAYELTYGPFPNKLEVCHSCDTPLCCNPHHLFLGTHQENMDDKAQKGRVKALRGDSNGHAKFTWQQVREIRARYAMGNITQRALAREHGVNQYAIWAIVIGKTWRE
jgi:hypothetical protein